MEKISIFWIDESNNIKGEKMIERPRIYNQFISSLKKEFPNLPNNYKIFCQSNGNDLNEINSDKEYKFAKNIFFIKEINQNDLDKSVFSLNYSKLSEEKQELLDERFNCFICSNLIKNEAPPFCYICQKNFHYKCLEKWENINISQNKTLSCPNCRNELPLIKWKKRLNFEEIRQNEANMMNELKKFKDRNDIFQKIINKKEFEKLENNETNIEEKFDVFKKLTSNLLKNILLDLNEINSLINFESNKNLTRLLFILMSKPLNPPINDIYDTIIEQFSELKKFIKNSSHVNNKNNIISNINTNKEGLNNDKKEINLIYYTLNEGKERIFGKTFVENNIDKIDLIINGQKESLIDEYLLKKGNNDIKLILKDNLNKIEEMFYGCRALKNIDDLKYLNTREIKNFSNIFFGCNSLTNINALENWDVSKGINFQGMFSECSSLLDIKPLKTWKVSNGSNFKNMFYNCQSLTNLTPLEDWNVHKNTKFSYMFSKCCLLKDLNGLEFWNVSNGKTFDNMFAGCKSLSNIEALRNWNVKKSINFVAMFENCSSLSDVKPLRNWNLSEQQKVDCMFDHCSQSLDLTVLKNWEIFSLILSNIQIKY